MFLIADIQNLVKNGPVVYEKSKFQFSNVNDLGPRSRIDLDLQYSHIFIKSISLRSYAAIVSDTGLRGPNARGLIRESRADVGVAG